MASWLLKLSRALGFVCGPPPYVFLRQMDCRSAEGPVAADPVGVDLAVVVAIDD
jgi:hypothetical protein